eukprot:1846100-Pyramimonas_sp.AAC.1
MTPAGPRHARQRNRSASAFYTRSRRPAQCKTRRQCRRKPRSPCTKASRQIGHSRSRPSKTATRVAAGAAAGTRSGLAR